MPAPKGNHNARGKRRVNHDRLSVSFSGETLDALYAVTALHEGGTVDEQQVRDYVRNVMISHLRQYIEHGGEAIIL